MIRRIVLVAAVLGLAVASFWLPREENVAADSLNELPPAVVFRADRGNATPPFVGRWELTFPEQPPTAQALTLQIGTPIDGTAPGRLTAAAGDPAALLAQIADVLSDRPAGAELPPVSELALRLNLIGDHVSVGHGDVGSMVIAGAFVADPAGDWRVYRVMLGEGGPECFLAISPGQHVAALLPRAIEDGPAIQARFRSLLKPRPATS
ncbi:MAG: hypothetical protein ABIT71_06575 [Vicinamibacteraceae bacterium]